MSIDLNVIGGAELDPLTGDIDTYQAPDPGTSEALSATKLTTARNINGVAFDGTAAITVPMLIAGIVTKTADYTIGASDHTILVDATAAPVTIALPAAASNAGRVLTIKKIDASVNVVTVDANASETIDGATTKTISTQWDRVTVHCDGAGWYIL